MWTVIVFYSSILSAARTVWTHCPKNEHKKVKKLLQHAKKNTQHHLATKFKTPISDVYITKFRMDFTIFGKLVLSVKPIVHMFISQFQKITNKIYSTIILLVDNPAGISGLVSLMNYKKVSGLMMTEPIPIVTEGNQTMFLMELNIGAKWTFLPPDGMIMLLLLVQKKDSTHQTKTKLSVLSSSPRTV